MATKTSRGLRNLNPGNIRRSKVTYRGEKIPSTDSAFKQFESIEMGYRAIFVLLHTYQLRGYADSIESIINRYAPPSENHTVANIRRLCNSTGFARDRKLDTLSADDMIPIVTAISAVENGIPADPKAVEAGWLEFRKEY